MDLVITFIKIVIAIAIFNVWILRYDKSTRWRGGNANSLKEEFAVYGLPGWSMVVVGFLKILFATFLIVSIWIPAVTKPAAFGLAVLMLGAIVMHFKVNDPLKKSLPAFLLLILCLVIGFG